MLQRSTIIISIALYAICTPSCRPLQNADSSKLDSIIDTDDMMTIDARDPSFNEFAPGIYASVFVQKTYPGYLNTTSCTGVIVEKSGNVLTILTNHQCLNTNLHGDSPKSPTLMSQQCSDRLAVYLYAIKGLEKHILKAPCVDGSLRTGYPYQVATFKVTGNIPEHIKPLKLYKDPLTENTQAYTVHYSEASTEHLRYKYSSGFLGILTTTILIPAPRITFANCAIKPTDAFQAREEAKHQYVHSCDNLGGSSGSAIIDRKTHHILGINWGEITTITIDKQIPMNVAVPSTVILERLLSQYD